MKNWKSASIFLASTLIALAAIAFNGITSTAGEKEKAKLNVTMQVNGMTCAGCVSGVESALKKVPGVLKAAVSLEKNEAYVEYQKGKTTPEELVKAVEKAGYKASVKSKEGEKSS